MHLKPDAVSVAMGEVLSISAAKDGVPGNLVGLSTLDGCPLIARIFQIVQGCIASTDHDVEYLLLPRWYKVSHISHLGVIGVDAARRRPFGQEVNQQPVAFLDSTVPVR